MLKHLRVGLAAIFVLSLWTNPSGAIVIRDDRAEEAYRVDPVDYPAVGDLGGVVGVLIDRRWVVTAGHTVEHAGNYAFAPWQITLGGQPRRFDKIIIHPGRGLDAVDSDYDLALLRLAEPIDDIAPIPLYEWSDEPGQTALLLGRGATGTGLSAPDERQRDNVLRRATNNVEAVFERSIVFVFDRPPLGTDLEGMAGAGDSGGPALIEREGVAYLAGVGSFNSGDENTASQYGTLDAYARVSAHRSWITETIASDGASTVEPWSQTAGASSFEALPNTSMGEAAEAFLRAVNTRRLSAIGSWIERYRVPSTQRTTQERAESMAEVTDAEAPYALLGYRTRSRDFALLFRTRDGVCRSLSFIAAADAPERVGPMAFTDVDCAEAP